MRARKRKPCPILAAGITDIDYKDVETLKRFTTDQGKILPRRISGLCATSQRHLSAAIRRSRYIALLPFVTEE
jgi:small subunit ribosomal protein S18